MRRPITLVDWHYLRNRHRGFTISANGIAKKLYTEFVRARRTDVFAPLLLGEGGNGQRVRGGVKRKIRSFSVENLRKHTVEPPGYR